MTTLDELLAQNSQLNSMLKKSPLLSKSQHVLRREPTIGEVMQKVEQLQLKCFQYEAQISKLESREPMSASFRGDSIEFQFQSLQQQIDALQLKPQSPTGMTSQLRGQMSELQISVNSIKQSIQLCQLQDQRVQELELIQEQLAAKALQTEQLMHQDASRQQELQTVAAQEIKNVKDEMQKLKAENANLSMANAVIREQSQQLQQQLLQLSQQLESQNQKQLLSEKQYQQLALQYQGLQQQQQSQQRQQSELETETTSQISALNQQLVEIQQQLAADEQMQLNTQFTQQFVHQSETFEEIASAQQEGERRLKIVETTVSDLVARAARLEQGAEMNFRTVQQIQKEALNVNEQILQLSQQVQKEIAEVQAVGENKYQELETVHGGIVEQQQQLLVLLREAEAVGQECSSAITQLHAQHARYDEQLGLSVQASKNEATAFQQQLELSRQFAKEQHQDVLLLKQQALEYRDKENRLSLKQSQLEQANVQVSQYLFALETITKQYNEQCNQLRIQISSAVDAVGSLRTEHITAVSEAENIKTMQQSQAGIQQRLQTSIDALRQRTEQALSQLVLKSVFQDTVAQLSDSCDAQTRQLSLDGSALKQDVEKLQQQTERLREGQQQQQESVKQLQKSAEETVIGLEEAREGIEEAGQQVLQLQQQIGSVATDVSGLEEKFAIANRQMQQLQEASKTEAKQIINHLQNKMQESMREKIQVAQVSAKEKLMGIQGALGATLLKSQIQSLGKEYE